MKFNHGFTEAKTRLRNVLEIFRLICAEIQNYAPALFPQARAPQMRTSREQMPMAIKARAVPVAMEVWGT